MFMSVFHNWLLEIACENYFVYIKRLSANDTGATGGHQVGLYTDESPNDFDKNH